MSARKLVQAQAEWFPRGDVDAIAVHTGFVEDDIALVDADPEWHASSMIYGSVAIGHRLLDGDSTLDRIQDAGKLSQDATASSVDDATGMLLEHWQNDALVRLEVPDGRLVVSAHEGAVAGYVSGEDCSQPASTFAFPAPSVGINRDPT